MTATSVTVRSGAVWVAALLAAGVSSTSGNVVRWVVAPPKDFDIGGADF